MGSFQVSKSRNTLHSPHSTPYICGECNMGKQPRGRPRTR